MGVIAPRKSEVMFGQRSLRVLVVSLDLAVDVLHLARDSRCSLRLYIPWDNSLNLKGLLIAIDLSVKTGLRGIV